MGRALTIQGWSPWKEVLSLHPCEVPGCSTVTDLAQKTRSEAGWRTLEDSSSPDLQGQGASGGAPGTSVLIHYGTVKENNSFVLVRSPSMGDGRQKQSMVSLRWGLV